MIIAGARCGACNVIGRWLDSRGPNEIWTAPNLVTNVSMVWPHSCPMAFMPAVIVSVDTFGCFSASVYLESNCASLSVESSK
jgi:hypothetical protein